MSLKKYQSKRRFKTTPEPKGEKHNSGKEPQFVIQKHYARSLHFDVRLEMGGVLKSWAVPKGPPKKIGVKHLAILTEDHPIEYAKFEGTIPEGEYGAGKVKIWDEGTYENVKNDSIKKCFQEGTIEVRFLGKKLKGTYALIHSKEKNWLMIKVRTKR